MGKIYEKKYFLTKNFMKKIILLLLLIIPAKLFAAEYSTIYKLYQWMDDPIEIRSATYAPEEETASGQLAEQICPRHMYEVMEMKTSRNNYWEAATLSGIYYRSNINGVLSGEVKNADQLLPNRGCICEINEVFNTEKKVCEKKTETLSGNTIPTTPAKNTENNNTKNGIFEGMQMEMRTTSMALYSENNKNLQNFLIATNYYKGKNDGIMTIWVL